MSIEFRVHVPHHSEPFTLDDYADYLTAVAACGSYKDSLSLPDEVHYNNPKTGNQLSIRGN